MKWPGQEPAAIRDADITDGGLTHYTQCWPLPIVSSYHLTPQVRFYDNLHFPIRLKNLDIDSIKLFNSKYDSYTAAAA